MKEKKKKKRAQTCLGTKKEGKIRTFKRKQVWEKPTTPEKKGQTTQMSLKK